MTTNTRLSEKRIDGLPSHAHCIGVDSEGDEHYYSSYDKRLRVSRDGEIVQTEDLSDRSLGEWVAFVRARRGWAHCHYSEQDAFSALAERVTITESEASG